MRTWWLGDLKDVLLVIGDRAGRSGAGVDLAAVDVDLSLPDADLIVSAPATRAAGPE